MTTPHDRTRDRLARQAAVVRGKGLKRCVDCWRYEYSCRAKDGEYFHYLDPWGRLNVSPSDINAENCGNYIRWVDDGWTSEAPPACPHTDTVVRPNVWTRLKFPRMCAECGGVVR